MRLVPRQQLRRKRPSRSKYVVVGGRFVGGGGGVVGLLIAVGCPVVVGVVCDLESGQGGIR